jgi:hypothetical protein
MGTRGCSEFDFNAGALRLSMRDVGGDESFRRGLRIFSLTDSLGSMFVVSLSDFTHMPKKKWTHYF